MDDMMVDITNIEKRFDFEIKIHFIPTKLAFGEQSFSTK